MKPAFALPEKLPDKISKWWEIMKKFAMPEKKRITVCGFPPEEIQIIHQCISSNMHVLYETDIVTDIIALDCEALLIKADAMTADDRALIIEYYTEVKEICDESVFWIGYPKPPSHLRQKFFCYESLDELSCVLPEMLVKAHQKVKKSRAFSKNLADCIQILSMIRLKPGIKTKELSEKLELPIRTVQRHITALQAAGEWIEYDTKKRGWQLQYGVSILYGDHLKDSD